MARLPGLPGLARLTAGAGRAAGTARAAGPGCPAGSGHAAVTTMAAVTAVTTSSTLAACPTLATAAVTAGGIEERRTADGGDRRMRQVSGGHVRGDQRSHRRGEKDSTSRTEYGHSTAIPSHLYCPHNLLSWVIWLSRSLRTGF